MRLAIGDVVRIREIQADTGEEHVYLGRIQRLLYEYSFGTYWLTRVLLEDGNDIFPDMIIVNVTRRAEKRHAVLQIWRS